MKNVSKEEFDSFLKVHALAIPDGFKLVGTFTQTKYFEGGKEVARYSRDGFGEIFEILD